MNVLPRFSPVAGFFFARDSPTLKTGNTFIIGLCFSTSLSPGAGFFVGVGVLEGRVIRLRVL
jgi:hypothetical protein